MRKMNNHEFHVTRKNIKSGKIIMDKNMKPKAMVSYLQKNIWDSARIADRVCYDLFNIGHCSFGADNDDEIRVEWA